MKVGEIVSKCTQRAKDIYNGTKLQVYGVSNLDGITITGNIASSDKDDYIYVEDDYFAYNPYRINVGFIGLAPKGTRGLVSPAYIVFKVDQSKYRSELLLRYLKSFAGLQAIKKHARGTVRQALRYEDLCDIDIPNLNENELQSLLGKIQNTEKEFDLLNSEIFYQQSLLNKLRQVILQDAIHGKLVPQDPNDEPANELLKRIITEKENLIAEGKIRKEKPLPPIKEEEISLEMPKGWVWCRLGEVSELCLGKMLDQIKNKGKELPYLRNINVRWSDFDLSDLKTMRFLETEEKRFSMVKGDLVVCEGGYPGRSAIWNGEEPIRFQKALHRVRVNQNILFNEYLFYCIKTDADSGRLKYYFTGAGIQHLTGKELKKYVIPLPPLIEQKRIVEKIKSLFRVCDQLEKQIEENAKHSELLLQSVLKEAFEG